jgi:hypothetical protein
LKHDSIAAVRLMKDENNQNICKAIVINQNNRVDEKTIDYEWFERNFEKEFIQKLEEHELGKDWLPLSDAASIPFPIPLTEEMLDSLKEMDRIDYKYNSDQVTNNTYRKSRKSDAHPDMVFVVKSVVWFTYNEETDSFQLQPEKNEWQLQNRQDESDYFDRDKCFSVSECTLRDILGVEKFQYLTKANVDRSRESLEKELEGCKKDNQKIVGLETHRENVYYMRNEFPTEPVRYNINLRQVRALRYDTRERQFYGLESHPLLDQR